MKVIPFINTIQNSEYFSLISQEFNVEIINQYFEHWYVSDMIGWHKLTNYNQNKIQIEFYGKNIPYKIKNLNIAGGNEFIFPYPNIIEDFICDCNRCFIDLYWSENIIDSMNRIHYMDKKEIEKYNTNLLTKIDK